MVIRKKILYFHGIFVLTIFPIFFLFFPLLKIWVIFLIYVWLSLEIVWIYKKNT